MKQFSVASLFSVVVFALHVGIVSAEDAYIIRVEEEWSVELGEPNQIKNAPQISMIMSPFSDLTEDYYLFQLNYRSKPEFVEGGLQVQHWHGDEIIQENSSPLEESLNSDSEVVKWTQRMSVNNGTVTFEVVDGQSTTWGHFGGEGYLKSVVQTGHQNLDSYRPAVSITESGIGYAGNRIASLTLQRITWYFSNGQKYEIHAPIDIDSDLDPWD